MKKFSGTIIRTRDDGLPTAVEVANTDGKVVGGWRTPYIDVWASHISVRDEVYTTAMRTLGQWMMQHLGDVQVSAPPEEGQR